MKLTADQIQENLQAIRSQGGSPDDAAEYLNSIGANPDDYLSRNAAQPASQNRQINGVAKVVAPIAAGVGATALASKAAPALMARTAEGAAVKIGAKLGMSAGSKLIPGIGQALSIAEGVGSVAQAGTTVGIKAMEGGYDDEDGLDWSQMGTDFAKESLFNFLTGATVGAAIKGAKSLVGYGASKATPGLAAKAAPVIRHEAAKEAVEGMEREGQIISQTIDNQTKTYRARSGKAIKVMAQRAANATAEADKAFDTMKREQVAALDALSNKFERAIPGVKKWLDKGYEAFTDKNSELGKKVIQADLSQWARQVSDDLLQLDELPTTKLYMPLLRKLAKAKQVVEEAGPTPKIGAISDVLTNPGIANPKKALRAAVTTTKQAAEESTQPFTVAEAVELKKFLNDAGWAAVKASKGGGKNLGKSLQKAAGQLDDILDNATDGATTEMNRAYRLYSQAAQRSFNKTQAAVAAGKGEAASNAAEDIGTSAFKRLEGMTEQVVSGSKKALGSVYERQLLDGFKKGTVPLYKLVRESSGNFIKQTRMLRQLGFKDMADDMERETVQLAKNALSINRMREVTNGLKKIAPDIASEFSDAQIRQIARELSVAREALPGQFKRMFGNPERTAGAVTGAAKRLAASKAQKATSDVAISGARQITDDLAKKTKGSFGDLNIFGLSAMTGGAAGVLRYALGTGPVAAITLPMSSLIAYAAYSKYSPTLARIGLKAVQQVPKFVANQHLTELQRNIIKRTISEVFSTMRDEAQPSQ